MESTEEEYDTSLSLEEIEELIEQRKKRTNDERKSLDKWQIGRRKFS